MLLKKTLLLFCIMGTITLYAQAPLQLRKQFFEQPEKRLYYAHQLLLHYQETTIDSLYGIGQFLISEGLEKQRKSWLYYGKYLISYTYNNQNELDYSYRNLNDCIAYYHRTKDLENLAAVQNLLGQTYFLEGRYPEAKNSFLLSMENHRLSHAHYRTSIAQLNLAEYLYATEQYAMAEKEVQAFLLQAESEHLEKSVRRGYNLLGKIYLATGRKKQAYRILEEALELAGEDANLLVMASCLNSLGIAYIENQDLASALRSFERALELREIANNPPLICESAFNLGEYFYVLNDWDKALEYYQLELKWAKKFDLLEQQADALEAIGYTQFEMGKKDLAFETAMVYADIQKQLLQKMRGKNQILGQDFRSQEREQDSQIARDRERILEKRLKNSEKTKTYILVCTILSLLGLTWFLTRKKSV